MVGSGACDIIWIIMLNCSERIPEFKEFANSSPSACKFYEWIFQFLFCLPWFIFLGRQRSCLHTSDSPSTGMNVDRLFAIKRPLVYQKAVENHKAGLVVAVWWLVQRKERKRDFKQIKKRLVALIPDLPLWFDRHIETGMSEHGCHCFVPIQNVSISRYFS